MYMVEVSILGNRWKVYLQDEDEYVDLWGDNDAAHTLPATKEIYFNEEELCRQVVTHELAHAYYAETCVSSASLNPDQVEEVMCELFGTNGNKMLKLSRQLFKDLKAESGT
jgi:hypothetical protein